MNLNRAIRWAPSQCTTPQCRIYKTRNGQYLHGKVGSPGMEGRPQWTLNEFLAQQSALARPL